MFARIKSISVQAIVVFLVTLSFCLMLISAMLFNRTQIERLTMERLVLEKSVQINHTLSRLLLRTQILTSLIVHSGGDTSNFAHLAAILIDDPAILNMLIAPGGIVSDIYPLEGNKAVLGLDFFYQETAADAMVPYETLLLAHIAKETRQLVMGGPFVSIQGWEILVGRQAVFLEAEDGTEYFWGIVGITLKHPNALDGAGLGDLMVVGFDYEIWRISPYDNERQVIVSSMAPHRRGMNYVDIPVNIWNLPPFKWTG